MNMNSIFYYYSIYMYVYIMIGICVINGIILDEIIFITSRLEYQEVTFKPSRIEL